MLVLGRRVGEKIVIGDNIVITILEARGDNIRIGIDAPRSVAVNRAEVLSEVTAFNQSASAGDQATADMLRRLVQARAAARVDQDSPTAP
jgi:carbon storage regulator